MFCFLVFFAKLRIVFISHFNIEHLFDVQRLSFRSLAKTISNEKCYGKIAYYFGTFVPMPLFYNYNFHDISYYLLGRYFNLCTMDTHIVSLHI